MIIIKSLSLIDKIHTIITFFSPNSSLFLKKKICVKAKEEVFRYLLAAEQC